MEHPGTPNSPDAGPEASFAPRRLANFASRPIVIHEQQRTEYGEYGAANDTAKGGRYD